MDLNSMSLDELKKLKRDVSKAIDSFEERARKTALAEVDAIARQHGFTIDQLLVKTAVKKRATVSPKYANPADASQTWSGRGRKPKWVIDALESGKSLEDLTI